MVLIQHLHLIMMIQTRICYCNCTVAMDDNYNDGGNGTTLSNISSSGDYRTKILVGI